MRAFAIAVLLLATLSLCAQTGTPLHLELNYATYFGGPDLDWGGFVALDPQGNLYVSGQFGRLTRPEMNATRFGNPDAPAFVAKFSPAGRLLALATIGGSSGVDQIQGMAVNATGIYIIGETRSPDFPTKNPIQPTLNSDTDVFVTKLTLDLKSIEYSTFLGGNWVDSGRGIAVDSDGNAYITGIPFDGFPLVNPVETVPTHMFVAKISPDGSHLIYSTYFGGGAPVQPVAIAVDNEGNAYVTGSADAGLPVTPGAIQTETHGTGDGFVAKFSPDGQVLYCTYLGGSVEDSPASITTDADGNLYVTGWTTSPDFPLVAPIQSTIYGSMEAFVTRINPAGTAITWSTLLGDISGDDPFSIAVDSSGRVYVEGESRKSSSGDMTTCHTPAPGESSDVYDVFIAVLNPANATVEACHVMPGGGIDYAGPLTLDSAGNIRTVITTWGNDLPLYDAPQPYNAGAFDLYVANYKLSPANARVSPIELEYGFIPLTTTSSASVKLTNGGTSALTISSVTADSGFSQTNDCGTTLPASGTCTIQVEFKPSTASEHRGWLRINSSPETVSPVWLLGYGADFKVSAVTSSATVKQGQSAAYQLELAQVGGYFPKPITFSCTGLPALASCYFSPNDVSPAAGTARVDMTISTRAPNMALLQRSTVGSSTTPGWLATLSVLPLAAVLSLKRRGKRERGYRAASSARHDSLRRRRSVCTATTPTTTAQFDSSWHIHRYRGGELRFTPADNNSNDVSNSGELVSNFGPHRNGGRSGVCRSCSETLVGIPIVADNALLC